MNTKAKQDSFSQQSCEASSRNLSRSAACPMSEHKLLRSMESIHKASRLRPEMSSRGNSTFSGGEDTDFSMTRKPSGTIHIPPQKLAARAILHHLSQVTTFLNNPQDTPMSCIKNKRYRFRHLYSIRLFLQLSKNFRSEEIPRATAAGGTTEKLSRHGTCRLDYYSLLDQLGWTIEVHHLEVGRRLGEGGFGKLPLLFFCAISVRLFSKKSAACNSLCHIKNRRQDCFLHELTAALYGKVQIVDLCYRSSSSKGTVSHKSYTVSLAFGQKLGAFWSLSGLHVLVEHCCVQSIHARAPHRCTPS